MSWGLEATGTYPATVNLCSWSTAKTADLSTNVYTFTDDVAPCSHYTCSVCSLYSSGGCGLRLVVWLSYN